MENHQSMIPERFLREKIGTFLEKPELFEDRNLS